MILKTKDTRTEDIQELNRLLSLNISSKQRSLVERELKCLMSGNSGESSAAYYLDFNFKDSKNYIVIHDLRIEHKGLKAQIDHLLINRFLDIRVIETKNYFFGVKITENGEFLSYNGKGYQAIESPIEQNKRHVELLQKMIEDRGLAPNRLGVSLVYMDYVLIAPNANVIRPPTDVFDTSHVIKADAFDAHLKKEVDNMSVVSVFASAPRIVGTDTMEEFAQKLIRLQRPGKFNYAAKFGIDEEATKLAQANPTSQTAITSKDTKPIKKACEKCGTEVDDKVVFFCRINKDKFGGKTLCRQCQDSREEKPEASETCAKSTACESCGTAVDSKVIYFCRINKAKFDGKILCRDCQPTNVNVAR
jgi:hypothetical protein